MSKIFQSLGTRTTEESWMVMRFGRGRKFHYPNGMRCMQFRAREREPNEWECKKCGLLRSNKRTHIHGKEMER